MTQMAKSEELGVSLDFLAFDNDTKGKEVYVKEIMERVAKMDIFSIKHILEYIDLYSKTEKERRETSESLR